MLVFEGTWNEWQVLDWAIIALAIVLLIVLTTILFKSPKVNNKKKEENLEEVKKGTEDAVLDKSPKQPKSETSEVFPIKNNEEKSADVLKEPEVKTETKKEVEPVALKQKATPTVKKTEPVVKKEEAKKQEPKKVIPVVKEPAKVVEEDDETENDVNKSQIRNKYHVSQNKDEEAEYAGYWRVRKEGSTKTIKFFKTQKEAIDYAEVLAVNQNGSIVIHKRDGTIRKQDYSKK